MSLRNAVLILGAGASKGARVAGKRTPPLDADFLRVASLHFSGRRARGKRGESVRAWNEFKARLASAGLEFSAIKSWRLEQLSTFLEARANLKGMQLSRGRPRDYARALECLKVVVCHVLAVEGGTRSCELHKRLIKLVQPSAVLSFNYDLIADQSLAESGLLNWRIAQYRCAKAAAVPTENGQYAYPAIRSHQQANHVPLLKLHGSMHYEHLDRGSGFRLSGAKLPESQTDSFQYQRVPKQPYIIPPIAAKIGIAQKALRERWYGALDYLHEAPIWVIWGYSFPGTDTISQVLFRAALAQNRKPKPVIVVNPDAIVAARVFEICQKVSVSHFSSMERFLLERGCLEFSEA